MADNQNENASDASLSNQEWNLLFGGPQTRSVVRGAALDVEDDVAMFQTSLFSKTPEQTEDRRNPLKIQEVDPLFLTRFVMFATHIAIPSVFQFILGFVQDHGKTSGNFVCDRNDSVIRGALFDETRYVEYKISLFTNGGSLGLSLDVLEGFAPAVQEFWKELQQALSENQYIESQETESEMESDAEWDLAESDEELPFDLELEDSKYLKLEEDPELVDQMFQDLSNPNFMQQTLLLLAWNCQDAQNFKAVTGENQAQQLFDTIIACMIASAADFCLPIARCASLLVSQLVHAHDIKVTEDQFNVLVQTLVTWSISNQGEQSQGKLTSSKEVADLLSSQMSKMASLAVNCKDTLERVYTQAPYDCVRANLHNVVRAY